MANSGSDLRGCGCAFKASATNTSRSCEAGPHGDGSSGILMAGRGGRGDLADGRILLGQRTSVQEDMS